MILRALAIAWFATGFAASAQAQRATPNNAQFDQFVPDLWKDAQAKGISRATFAKAFDGVTPDPRVIATTKKQPEYGKPAGLYVSQIASPLNARQGLKKEAEWRSTLGAGRKKKPGEGWGILALWGGEKAHGG